VAIVATEMVGNLVTHASHERQILLRALPSGDAAGVELMTLDKGPGITDIAQALRDGHSTAGTPGTGLGAVLRLSSVTDIHSVRGMGTALLAQVWRGAAPPDEGEDACVGGVCVPKSGETRCGDAWTERKVEGRRRLLLADGLGHGEHAADAADAALAAFAAHPELPPVALVEAIHVALRGTRGAAVGVVDLDPANDRARYAGVGNIAGVALVGDERKSLVFHHGTAGGEVRRIEEFGFAWPSGSLLIAHTDGLSTRWNVDDYPGLSRRHPSLIAGVLYRDFARGSDDVTVVVATRSAAG
jgi:hypothetical protein